MDERFIEVMRDFAGRDRLARKVTLAFRDDGSRERIYCDAPQIVARFASRLRQRVMEYWGEETIMLLRGQSCDHPGMVPSLFRPSPDGRKSDVRDLLKGEEELVTRLRRVAKPDRFKRTPLAALLQHYGFRTSWMDLVDGLWAAVWFATYEKRESSSGWLYFLAANPSKDGSEVKDLRVAHHGLSLRPHTQHGWSLRGPEETCSDLQKAVVGAVEFPLTSAWSLGGEMFSREFMFPSPRLDHTLSYLKEKHVDSLAEQVERDLNLWPGALGRLDISR